MKKKISCVVIAQLISTFVFATQTEASISNVLKLYSLVLSQTWTETLKTGCLMRWLIYHINIYEVETHQYQLGQTHISMTKSES